MLKNLPDLFFKYCGLLYVYLSPLHVNLVTIYLLLLSDLISGITNAFKKEEKITAAKLVLTVYKFCFYTLVICLAFQVDVALFSASALVLTHLIGYYITLVEFKSNVENISSITNTDIWVAIKDKVGALFNSKTNT